MTTILAVANQKGGVAKTTTVASLAAALHALDRRVLVVDLDPQGCLTFSLGHNPDKLDSSVHEVLTGDAKVEDVLIETAEGIVLLPATIDLAGAEALLLMRAGREFALKRALAPILEDFDVVVIDCPPSLGVLTLNGLTAAQSVLVPLQCETLAHRGVGQLLRTVSEVQQITNPTWRCSVPCPHCSTPAPRTAGMCSAMSRTAIRCRCSRRRFRGPYASPRPVHRARRYFRAERTRVRRPIENSPRICWRTGTAKPI